MKYLKKSLLSLFAFVVLLGFSNCEHKHLCPTYMKIGEGTVSVQDGGAQTAEDVRQQSLEQLDTQGSYIRVKRNKKTGLVKSSKRYRKSKKKNVTNSKKRKDYKKDPATLMGVGG